MKNKAQTQTVELEDLYKLVDSCMNHSCKPTIHTYKQGHIFDEEKSVRWNKEEVERRNTLYLETKKNLNKEHNKLINELEGKIILYIFQNTDGYVTEDRARKIYNYIYENYHSYDAKEYINELDNIIELFTGED